VAAFKGYGMLRACMADTAECGDISPGQVADRMQLLNKAADAGLHGAAQAYTNEFAEATEGLATENPVFKEWLARSQRADEQGALHGDRFALLSMSNRYEFGVEEIGIAKDISKSLSYWVAFNEATLAEKGKPAPGYARITERLVAQLSPEQASAAISAGKQLIVRGGK
jgi:hypothetical protein